MMAVGQAFLRAFAALLLAMAIASPAVAEIACAADSFAHAAEGGDAESLSPDSDDDHDEAPGQDTHCAFSHGHCGGMVPSGAVALAHDTPASGFRLVSDPDASSLLIRGPERPPRS